MKALILAGGRGKRLKGNTDQQNKCMLELFGRPIIQFSLDNAAKTDVNEILIVVGYRAEDIIQRIGNQYKGKNIRYVSQPEQKGLVHAIECAESAIDGEDFMLLLGDEIMLNPRHPRMVEEFERENMFVVCGVLEEKDKKR